MSVLVELKYTQSYGQEAINTLDHGRIKGFPTYKGTVEELGPTVYHIQEAMEWLKENDISATKIFTFRKVAFIFGNEADALAFKLMWL